MTEVMESCSITPLHHLSMPRFILFLFLALALTQPLQALTLTYSVQPRIGQRGTTVEVAIRGSVALNDTKEIIFDGPGIRAVAIGPMTQLSKPDYVGFPVDHEVKCRFEIAPDCAPGEHRFRVRTATQLSGLATFHVTPFPVVDEVEGKTGNDTPATAQSVPLEVTIRGSINNSARGDVDLYRVPAKAGERLSVEVDCVRLAHSDAGSSSYSTACDLALRVIDAAGRELAANDENPLHVQDPLLSLKLPADIGDYVFVEARTSVFDRHKAGYALHLGRFERPLAVYPAGGPPGEKLSVTLLGDPLGDRQTEIRVPNQTGTFQPFNDVPSGLPMRSFAGPNVLEDQAAGETPVPQIPAALNGILSKPGEVDRFRVKVKKGDRLRLRVYAATLGSPLDPFLNIRKDGETQPEISGDDASGRGLADRDIFGPSPRSGTCMKDTFDPSILWEPKSDGDYLVEIGANGGEGPTGVYRIEVMPPPDTVFSVLYARDPNTWNEHIGYTGLAVPQGNHWTVNVSLPFGQGTIFKGDMEIVAPGLPPGVTLGNTRISGAEHAARVAASRRANWPVEFIAGPDAKPGGAVITLAVRSTDPAKKIETGSMQWIPFLNSYGGDAWRVVKTERFIMAVTDPAPFSIELQAPTAPLVRGGGLAIPVKLTRCAGFDEPIDFACDNAPVGVNYQAAETIAGDRSEAVLQVTADANARLGAGPLSLVAYTRRSNHQWAHRGVAGEIRVSAPIILLNVAEPYLALSSEPASVRRGGRVSYRWTVTPKTAFAGEAEVKLLGLPKGVTVREPLPRITAAAKEVVFQVEATDEALLGPASSLECEIIVHAAGQEIRQRTGKGILRIDPKL
jgi:hypothetical protein